MSEVKLYIIYYVLANRGLASCICYMSVRKGLTMLAWAISSAEYNKYTNEKETFNK